MTNQRRVNYYVPIQKTIGVADLDTLYDSDEALLARAAELRERHERLMATDPVYKQYFEWLPDRSDFVSGVPARVPATVGMLNVVRWMRNQYHHSAPISAMLGKNWNKSKRKKPKVK